MIGDVIHTPGTIKKYQKEVYLKIDKRKKLLSVVDKKGQHIYTYKINESKLGRMAVDKFWIW